MHYEVAVMNYPLFEAGRTRQDTRALLLDAPPYFEHPALPPAEMPVYIHIPFCDSLCDFCVYNRVAVPRNREVLEEYLQALLKELAWYASAASLQGHPVGSVLIGGGTPTVFSEGQLERLLTAVRRCFGLRECEITLECNPINASAEKLRVLKENGVTRVSIGVQTFCDAMRRRLHIALRGEQAAEWLKEACGLGFDDVSLDLMYGFPGMGSDELRRDLEQAAALGVGHISLYRLTLFAYTKMYRDMARRGGERLPDEEQCLELFRMAHRYLLSQGYALQSAQEYGKQGRAVRFWENTYDGYGPNLALGVSGFGYLGGYCYQNESRVEDYIRSVREGKLPVERMSRRITDQQLLERALAMGLRRGSVSKARFRQAFGKEIITVFAEVIDRLIRRGLLRETPDAYELTENGLFFQGDASVECMESVFRGVSPLKKKWCIGSHTMP